VKILKRLVDLYELEEKYEYSIEIINEILEIEPYDEEMILKLMDIYSLSGKRAAAINYYNNYSNGLAGSLGISPSDGLKNKYNEIKSKRDEHYKNFMQKERIIDCKQKNKLIITSDCMKNIDYFWLSDVIGKLLKNIDEGIIKRYPHHLGS